VRAVYGDLFADGSNLGARFVRLLLRLYPPFLKSPIVLILFRQENRGYREVVVGDDPKLVARIGSVAGKDLEATFQAELVFRVVHLAQVSPITARVALEKLRRTALPCGGLRARRVW